MQEEMTGKAIALTAQTAEVTIDILKDLIKAYFDIRHQKKRNKLAGKKEAKPKVKQGKQSVKKLLGQGKGVESIDINSNNIGLFTSSARRYGVDFAMTKDKNTDPPTHTIFFKGKDAAAITSAFKDFVGREENKIASDKKKSLDKQLKKLDKEIKKSDISLDKKGLAAEMKKAHRGEASL